MSRLSFCVLTAFHSLKKLREKLKLQRQHLDELDKHIEELQKESGGEQH
jgi:biotin operon repressor